MKTLISILKEHIEYRQQVFKLAKADIIRTYRGAALGWSWAIVKPVFTIFVYWFAFAIGLRSSGKVNGYPFLLWLIAGLIPWFYMNEMLTQGMDSIKKYYYLVTKMKFPVSTIPTFVSLSKLFVNCILTVMMIAFFAIYGYKPDIYLLQLPVYILCMYLFFTSTALCGAMITVISKDFSNLIKSLITGIFWLSGILWDPENIKIGWLKKVLNLNPVTFICGGFRNVFIKKIWFFDQPKRLLYFAVIYFIMLVLSLLIYKKLRKEIPDVL